MATPSFHKETIGELPNAIGHGPMNTLCVVGDFNGDGRPDVAVCGRQGRMAWFENPGARGRPWNMRVIGEPGRMECGGCALDVTGNGLDDIINGGDSSDDAIYWFENPGPASGPWKQRVIARTGRSQFHDTVVGDVKNDGRMRLAFTNQMGGTTIYCVPIPANPAVEPWPELEVVAAGKNLPNPRHPWNAAGVQPHEGLAIGDVDGDGQNELVCGVHWFKYKDGEWEEHRFTNGDYISTKVAIGDIDGDGRNEIVLSEGDACIYGHGEGCKLAWFKPGGDLYGLWQEHVIETGLLDAHTLCLADLCGNGNLDVLVGEVGVVNTIGEDYAVRAPRVMIYENDGAGRFPTRHTIDEGTGTHEAKLMDLLGRGRPDLVGKPLHGAEKWGVHVWYSGDGATEGATE